MSYAFVATGSMALTAFLLGKDDWRFGAFFLAVFSGMGAVVAAFNGL